MEPTWGGRQGREARGGGSGFEGCLTSAYTAGERALESVEGPEATKSGIT